MGNNKLINCEDCGIAMKRLSNAHKICKFCAIIRNRVFQKEYKKKNYNKEKAAINWKNYYAKNRYKIKRDLINRNAYQKKWVIKYPKKAIAHRLAVKLPLKMYCERCNSNNRLERHHPDYDQPKFFITLCKNCHQKEHIGGEANRSS